MMMLSSPARTNLLTRSGIKAAIFLVTTVVGIIACAPTTHALSITLDLPLGDRLHKLIDPVNSLTSPLVTIQTPEKKLGASVAVQPLTTPSQPINVSLPAPRIVPALLDTVTKTAPATSGLLSKPAKPATNTPPSSPPMNVTTANTDPQSSTISGPTKSDKPQQEKKQPPKEQSISNFFASSLPTALKNFVNTVAGKEVGPLPTIISVVILLLTILGVFKIVHASNHGGRLVIGNYNLAQFAGTHDVTQMLTFVVALVSLGVVVIFLTLTGL